MDRVGQDQDRLDPAFVLAALVAQVGQDLGEERHHRIEPGDGRERAADVEPAHPVLGRRGGVGELATPLGLLTLRGRGRVGGLDRGLDQQLEPGPRDPPVGGLGDPLIDVVGLLPGQVAGLAGHEPGIGDLHLQRLHPRPQPRQPVTDVEPVGHQLPRGIRRHPEPGTEGGRGELRHQRRALTPEPAGPLTTRCLQLPGRDRLGVVQDRVLHRRPQNLDLGLPLGARQLVDMVEQLTTRQTPEIHDNSQTPTTDTRAPRWSRQSRSRLTAQIDAASARTVMPLCQWCGVRSLSRK